MLAVIKRDLMKIIDKKNSEITNNKKLNSKFLSVFNNDKKLKCKILTGDFFLDSFNFFPITDEYNTFRELFSWGEKNKYENFYSNNFLKTFNENKIKFKKLSNVFILGSSPGDNYYRNMTNFLPRIFFIKDKNINIAVHRNLSNKFRNFIYFLGDNLKIKINLIFLDDDFYKFSNSQIPQFFLEQKSINIINKLIVPNNKKKDKKIYLSRQNSDYRNLINEEDVIKELKKKDFQIVDLNNYEIIEQIELFASAKVIISPTSSSLANILFCSRGTKVIEICPKYRFDYENVFKLRYSFICNRLGLNYQSIEADSINLENLDPFTKKFISENVLNESNYYKNLIIKIDNIQNVL